MMDSPIDVPKEGGWDFDDDLNPTPPANGSAAMKTVVSATANTQDGWDFDDESNLTPPATKAIATTIVVPDPTNTDFDNQEDEESNLDGDGWDFEDF